MSPFYSFYFDKIMNSDIQQCQMNIVIIYWNEITDNAGTRYYDSKFFSGPNATELLSSIKDVAKNFKH